SWHKGFRPMTDTDIVERLRAADISGHGSYSALVREAADEIELLRENAHYAKGTAEAQEAAIHQTHGEIERLTTVASDMLAVLNACRITIKNRDQRPDEMKLLDAIKVAIANAEDVLGVER